jgi:hypothetical protein
MGIGAASYGNYLKVRTNTPYIVTVRVRKPGSSRIEEAQFERRFE